MPMKISLALGRAPVSRQTAWGCLTTNLALPGFGSLLAGRRVGYVQAVLALIAFAMSMITMIQLFIWFSGHWSRLHDASGDPLQNLVDLWNALRWPLISLALFVFDMLWALGTSMDIIRAAKAAEQAKIPPRLGRSPGF